MKKFVLLLALVPSMALAVSAGRLDTVVAKTVTSSSTKMLDAADRTKLTIDNESTTAKAAINTAGSYTFIPGQTRIWSTYPVPSDQINCTSSAATSPATFEVK